MRAKPFPALRAFLFAGLLGATPLAALAQATPEEAARLQGIGETYFGRPAPGAPPVVRVVPEGDHYRASLDFAPLLTRLVDLAPAEERKGIRLEWPALSLALAPAGDGYWRFWDYRIPRLTLTADGQTTEVDAEGTEFETVFDPATGVTRSMKGRFGRIAATSKIQKPGEEMAVSSENVSTDVVVEGAATATATPGVVDGRVRQTTGSILYALEILGGAAGGVPDMRIALTGGKQDQDLGITGLRHTAILDLWAFLVAHPSREELTRAQSTLKARISAALPLFEGFTQKVVGTAFAIESPFAVIKAGKAGIDLDLAGVVRDGRFAMAIAIGDFEAYSLFMPKWANKLMPKNLALAGRVTGYDLATPLKVFLDGADFAADKPLTPEQEAAMAVLLLPKGAVEVTVDGNRISGPLYDVALDGRLASGPAGTKGAVTIRAKGVEAVATHLAAPGADEQAKAMGAMLAMARQFAERKGDEMVWRVDFDGNDVSVNGKPLK